MFTGRLIASRYAVERVLETGAVAVLLAAHDQRLEKRVVLKLLRRDVVESDPRAAESFRRELRALARIDSQHVCQILDAGTDDGAPFLVMEYLSGCDLASELAERGRLPPCTAVELIRHACRALAAAHAAGIVHRGLRPENLFVARQAGGRLTLKLLDFGLNASLRDDAELALTRRWASAGSALYMAPEQLQAARDADERCDVWALACILFELISGTTPFAGDSLIELLFSVLMEQPRTLAELGIAVPARLQAVLSRALRKRPDERFQSVAELTHALAPFGVTGRSSPSSADPYESGIHWRRTDSRVDDPVLRS